MGSLKALQEWCRLQCENYKDVEIKNMSTSFRDGLAFCAIIHKHRPDLIDFDSLSKENVYENNRLAFEMAESELGIPALLDPEDMVSMKVPDRLSIITYVSQYYNFFTNKSHANPPCMKRSGGTGHNEPVVKRPLIPANDGVADSKADAGGQSKRSTLSSTCAACQKHVHLVQRFLVDGKLYHRNCFRCKECSSTLLPGSYKLGSEAGSLVCTHHFAKSSSASQNGRPDLSRGAGSGVEPGGGARAMERPGSIREEESPGGTTEGQAVPPRSMEESPDEDSRKDSSDGEMKEDQRNGETVDIKRGKEMEVRPQPSTPPNPFEDSEEEEPEKTQPIEDSFDRELPSAPTADPSAAGRPVPAPRRVSEPLPRPTPRARQPRMADSPTVNGDAVSSSRYIPTPRERSHSPASISGETPKSKDPPWLALVQSQSKKKPAPPPPPPPGTAPPPRPGSMPSVGGPESWPASPQHSTNPFEDDDAAEVEGEEQGEQVELPGSSAPPSAVVNHPWYGIMQGAEGGHSSGPASTDITPNRTPSQSPGSQRVKKRPAPRVPQPSPTDHSSSRALPESAAAGQDPPFTKSVSEPSINGPALATAGRKTRPSSSPPPPPVPTNTSSAPATPQTNRSAGMRTPRPPPPRPPTTPSPLAKVTPPPPPPQGKRTCKENPFDRKASPSSKPTARPPRGPRPARPPAPGHGFPLIKRKVQSDQYIPVEDIHVEMGELERRLDELEHRGVELEQRLRECQSDEEEERLLVDWFTLIHDKHMLVRREVELVYTAKQQNLEERQADVEYELRCLLNKPEKEWSEEDRNREKELMAELVTIIEDRNQIINSMDQDRQREEEEDKILEAVIKKKEFHKELDVDPRKKGAKFKPSKVLKMLSPKSEGGKNRNVRKDKS
ncbi:MICAL-like protein 1 isoform X2 [Brienomyrus brachyistius]|uniref:MICAL-like protein 1 isoform X2 n=1 Tax=Brienomyrus brachyistius TaxID=42636 RepID=UPI0020B3B1C5|nr:MICAL-like protein 1 isoform X2 [Brienomyrus brachyistius]